MRRKSPAVREYMTRLPVEVERCDTVGEAVALMETHGIRHIPVLSGSRLVGVVSQRDLAELKSGLGDSFESKPLENVCTRDVATVSPVDPATQAARLMLERGVGSVIVVDQGFVVGIFTTTDALRLICDLFHA